MTNKGCAIVFINTDILSLISGRRNAFFNVLQNKLYISYRTICGSTTGTNKDNTDQVEVKGKKENVAQVLTVLNTLKQTAKSNGAGITLESLRREIENIQINKRQKPRIDNTDNNKSNTFPNAIVDDSLASQQQVDMNASPKCSKESKEISQIDNEQGDIAIIHVIPRRKRGRPPKNELSKSNQVLESSPSSRLSRGNKGEKNIKLLTSESSQTCSDGNGTSVKDGTTIVKRSSGETVSFTKLELSDASPERKKELLRHLKCAPNVRLGRKRKSVIPMPPQKMFIYTPVDRDTNSDSSPEAKKMKKDKMKYNIYELDIDFKTAKSISEMDQMELSQFIALSCTKRQAQINDSCEKECASATNSLDCNTVGDNNQIITSDTSQQSNDENSFTTVGDNVELRKEEITLDTNLAAVELVSKVDILNNEKPVTPKENNVELSEKKKSMDTHEVVDCISEKSQAHSDNDTIEKQNSPISINAETKSMLNQLGLIRKDHDEFPGDNEESFSEGEETEDVNLDDDRRESESIKGFADDDDFVDIMTAAMKVSSVSLKKIQNLIEADIAIIEKENFGRATFSYPCLQSGCKFETKAKCTLRYHMRRKHMPRLFICPLCNFEFGMAKDLWKHIHTHNERHTCGICGSQYRSPTTLRLHLKRHEEGYNPQPYHCDKCEKKFTHKHSLQSHCSIVHDGTGKRFHCKYCNRSFSQKNHMLEHENIHSDNRPHKCSICEKTFHHMSSLRHHMDIHDPIKKFKCTECGKHFKQRNSLHMHMVTHSGPCYKCDICPKMFTQKQALLRHNRIHTGDRPFMCKLCKRHFSDQSILRRHLIGVHKVQKRDARKEMCVQIDPPSPLIETNHADKTVYVVVQKEAPKHDNLDISTFNSENEAIRCHKNNIKEEQMPAKNQTLSVPQCHTEPSQSTEEISTDEATEPDIECNERKDVAISSSVVLNYELNQPEELSVSSETRVITSKGLILYECLLCRMKYTNEDALLYHAKQVHKTLARNAVQPKTTYMGPQRQQTTKQNIQNKPVENIEIVNDIETIQMLLSSTSPHMNKAPVLYQLVTQKTVPQQPSITIPQVHVVNEPAIKKKMESTTFSTTDTGNTSTNVQTNGVSMSILKMPSTGNPPISVQESDNVDMSVLKMPNEGFVRIMDQNLSGDGTSLNHIDINTKDSNTLPQVMEEITVTETSQLAGENQVQISTSPVITSEAEQNAAESFAQVTEANLIENGITVLETESGDLDQEQYHTHTVEYLIDNNSYSQSQAIVAELNEDGTIIFPENFVIKDNMVYITTDVNNQNDT